MKIVAFLPVKGSSERIENKNIKLLDGKPLFLHSLEKLVSCSFIDEIYLDSDSEKIFDLASEINCKFLKRDPSLATNKTDGHKLFYNEAKHVDAEIYVQLLATSPFIKKETIEKGINILKIHLEYDSVVLIKKDKQYLWQDNNPLYNKEHIPNSIDLPDTVIETMGLYITRKHVALENKMRFGDKVYLLEASPIEAIDVNFPEDFDIAELIAAGKREKERKMLNNLKHYLTSSLLSDILDDFGREGAIRSLSPNIQGIKTIGRAKTLKLRKLKENEDYRGIYTALKSYSMIVPNDVIVVENELQDYAYFGELNANLAIRQGAVGAIIQGKTRDTMEVKSLNFPVFAKGNSCKDVRKRATVESINKKIKIDDITIHSGDLIFADNDGIIVIPKDIEEQVLKKAVEKIATEKNIILDIILGNETTDLYEKFGEF